MGQLQSLARQLDTDERTLRRAVELGVVRATRPSPRLLEVSEAEREYLRTHWPLLRDLRRALRTEPGVRMAVLYGSAARGEDDADSDVDLLVDLDDERPVCAARLALRLSRSLGREVDVARMGHVEQSAPMLLLDALDEGRVVVDRARRWPTLRRRRASIARRAEESFASDRAEARRAMASLTAEPA